MKIKSPLHLLGLCAALLSMTASAHAQGTIAFNNNVSGIVRAPVYGLEGDPTLAKCGNTAGGIPAGSQTYGGPLLAGTGFTAQLWGGPFGTAEGGLTLAATTTFRAGPDAGFLVAPTSAVMVTGVPAGELATVQVRAWDNRGGTVATWADALADPTVARGACAGFTAGPMGSNGVSAASLSNLVSFNIHRPAPPISYSLLIRAGFNLIANQLVTGSNGLNEIMPDVPAGTTLFKFDNATLRYQIYTFDDLDLAWEPDNGVLNPGEGAWLVSPSNFTLTLTGQPHIPVPYSFNGTGCRLLSRQTNDIATPDDIYDAAPGDIIYKYTATGYQISTFDDIDLAWTPSTPSFGVGEAAWFCRGGGPLPIPDPAIISQPQSLAVQAGDSASFTVLATGTAPLRYQWRFNGTNRSAGTNATYSINNAQTNDSGNYSVVVFNGFGSVTSLVATLTVELPCRELIVTVLETGGDTSGPTAKFTGQTFNHPVEGNNFTVPRFSDDVPAFTDQHHQWNGVRTNLDIPPELTAGQYVMIQDSNKDNPDFRLDVRLCRPSLVYLLVDNRVGDNDRTNPPTFGAVMPWVTANGWVPVQNGHNRAGDGAAPDEVGLDRNGDGSGPGVSVEEFYSVYVKQFSAGTFTVYPQNDGTNRNMYGVVIPAGATGLACDNFSVTQDANTSAQGRRLLGSAVITDGIVHLTDAVSGQTGSLVLDDQNFGLPFISFRTSFKLLMGGGTTAASADGFSFNFAPDLPNAPFGEEGAGSGLTVSFDSFNNGGGEAPAIDVKWNGQIIGTQSVQPSQGPGGNPVFKDVSIELFEDGSLSVDYDANAIFAGLPTPWPPGGLAGRFGFGARTGSFNDRHWLDDVCISGYSSGRPLVMHGPTSLVVTCGCLTVFSVLANGDAPLTYQWFHNGTAIPNATDTLLTLTNVQPVDAGTYSVVVCNLVGCVTNGPVTLTVIKPGNDLALTGGPLPDSVVMDDATNAFILYTVTVSNQGATEAANVVVTAHVSPAQVALATLGSGEGGCSGAGQNMSCQIGNLAAGTSTTVALGLVAANYGHRPGESISLTAGVSANGADTQPANNQLARTWFGILPPVFSAQPANLVVLLGGSATFTAGIGAGSAQPLTYQWRLNGVDLPGQIAPTLNIASVTIADYGTYSVRVANAYGQAVSEDAILSNTPLSPDLRVWITQPSDVIPVNGQTTFIVAVTNRAATAGNVSLTVTLPANFQVGDIQSGEWENAVVIGNQLIVQQAGWDTGEGAILTVRGAVPGASQFSVTANAISDPADQNPGDNSATLSVAVGDVPVILVQPTPQSMPPFSTVTFSVTAQATAPLHYQWRFNGQPLEGATSPTLVLPAATSEHGGTYDVIAYTSGGAVTSDPASLALVFPNSLTVILDGNGTLHADGTVGPDSIQLRLKANDATQLQFVDKTAGTVSTYPLSSIHRIEVDQGDGDDVFILDDGNGPMAQALADANIPIIVAGGPGNNLGAGSTIGFSVVRDGDGTVNPSTFAVPFNYQTMVPQLRLLGTNIVAQGVRCLTNDSFAYILDVYTNVALVADQLRTSADMNIVNVASNLMLQADNMLRPAANNYVEDAVARFHTRLAPLTFCPDPYVDCMEMLIMEIDALTDLLPEEPPPWLFNNHHAQVWWEHTTYILNQRIDELEQLLEKKVEEFEAASDAFEATADGVELDADAYESDLTTNYENVLQSLVDNDFPTLEATVDALDREIELYRLNVEGPVAQRGQALEQKALDLQMLAYAVETLANQYQADFEAWLALVDPDSGDQERSLGVTCPVIVPNGFVYSSGGGFLIGSPLKDKLTATSGALIIGLGGDDHLIGSPGTDVIVGGKGNDVIEGNAGDDFLLGMKGDDCIKGGKGIDIILGGKGSDMVDGGDGIDIIFGGPGGDMLHGGKGRDLIVGGPLVGLDDMDTIDGEEDIDFLFGGDDMDTINGQDGEVFNNLSNVPIHIGNLIVGNSGNDKLKGGKGIDLMLGNDGDDEMRGKYHVDIMLGGKGEDKMWGGYGGKIFRILVSAQTSTYVIVRIGNIMLGGDEKDIEIGGADQDIQLGQEGNDDITGGDGLFYFWVSTTGSGDTEVEQAFDNDIIFGGLGDDTANGTKGHDLIIGGPGKDTLYGDKDDFAALPVSNDLIAGGDGDDCLFGGWQKDVILGGAGNDIIHGDIGPNSPGGVDFLFGGTGDDEMHGDGFADFMFGQKGKDIMHGDDGQWFRILSRDYMFGGDDDDLMYGGASGDMVFGGKGNDIIHGGFSLLGLPDVLVGNQGCDTIYGEEGGDLILGGSEQDMLYGGGFIDVIMGGHGDDFIEGGPGADILFGGPGNDTISGNDGPDFLYGGLGNDLLHGNDGPDWVLGGADDDHVYGDDGPDFVFGNRGKDYVSGGDGPDFVGGGYGNDAVFGDDGLDIVRGGPDDDYVDVGSGSGGKFGFGGYGRDTVRGGPGNDWLFGGFGSDVILCEGGNDRAFGGPDNDRIRGDAGNDFLFGGFGSDCIEGGDDKDKIWGGPGDDTLCGGSGKDWLFGGCGYDTLKGGPDKDKLIDFCGGKSKDQDGEDCSCDFSYTVYPGEVHGCKWLDLNGNGVRDPSEPGLAGVVIYADYNGNGTLDSNEPWVMTMLDNLDTKADETGCYWLTGIAPGQHQIREVTPTGSRQTFPASIYQSAYVERPTFVADHLDFGNHPCEQIAPTVVTVEVDRAHQKLLVCFSEAIDPACMAERFNPPCFRICGPAENPVTVTSIQATADPRCLCVNYNGTIVPMLGYTLFVSCVCDLCGNVIANNSPLVIQGGGCNPNVLTTSYANGHLTLNWSVGVLQQATNVSGPWLDTPNTNGTVTIRPFTPGQPVTNSQFFRVRISP